MIPQKVELRFDTFDIVTQNDSGPDEPYVWTFFVKLDGTAINLFSPQDSHVKVHSPAGSHGDLNLPGDDMTAADAPRAIPKAVGRWETTLEQGNLLNLVIPQIAVAALIVAWEEDIFPSTAAMEEARVAVRNHLSSELTRVVREVVQNCLAHPENCSADIDFESEISVERLREAILDVLKEKMGSFIAGAILVNPLFALVGDRDEFIGYGLAGPYFLPKILGANNFRENFTVDLRKGEKDTPGHYRVKGHLALIEPQMWAQPAAARTDASVHVIGRDPVVDFFFKSDYSKGEFGPFKKIGEGKFKSGPAVVVSSDGKLMHAFGLGLDNHFWRAWSNTSGKSWSLAWKQMPSGIFTSPPAAALSGDGKKVFVFGRGKDNKIWMSRSSDGGDQWSGWSPIGEGLFLSGPSACCSADGQRLYVFGTGLDHRAWWALSTDGGKTWKMAWSPILSGILQSAPAAVCSDDAKRVRVFGRGNDKRYWWASSDDSGVTWSGWSPMETGAFISTPAVCMTGDGKKINVFGIGENMLLYHNGSADFGVTYKPKFSRIKDDSTYY